MVLDANILIRAVLEKRVREILEGHSAKVSFFAPDTAFAEAREHLPEVLLKRGIDPAAALAVLAEIGVLIGCVESETNAAFDTAARQRLRKRDEEDWPVLAAGLALNCPIWTEDTDFFGAAVATWTTDRVELLLQEVQAGADGLTAE